MLEPRLYHNEPPPMQTRIEMNPTLIVSWWCTLFALTAILIRLFGRWVRTERLFREDWIMMYSIIPLMIRMGLVHVVLIWGTNNIQAQGLTSEEIRHREIGSQLVLAARIFYAAYIWIAKLAVLEFLKRLIGKSWARSYEDGLRFIYGFLVVTYIGVVIGTLSECQPFDHYWQVVPDPGPKCREGLVQLIVMGVCDMITDLVLIIFPIPLVWQSSMRVSKKISLVALFLLSTILIAITAYRVPSTIDRGSPQPYRSLLASLEILASAGVSNAIVIGSFVRDKGVKKNKFRAPSTDATSSLGRQVTRTRTMSVTHHHWGSDEDLAKSVGVSLPRSLRHGVAADQPARPAEVAGVAISNDDSGEVDSADETQNSTFKPRWNFAEASRNRRRKSLESMSSTSTNVKLRNIKIQLEQSTDGPVIIEPEPDTPSRMGFFDVGGLVDKPPNETPVSRSRQVSIQEATRPSPQPQPNQAGTRSSSRAFLHDIGGLLTRNSHIREEEELDASTPSTSTPRKTSSPGRSPMRSEKRKISRNSRLSSHIEEDSPPPKPSGPDDLDFSDAGGLLRS